MKRYIKKETINIKKKQLDMNGKKRRYIKRNIKI